MEQPGVLAVEPLCLKCRYNLRGLPFESPCPECGCLVSFSLRDGLLHNAPREWLQRVSNGLLTFIIGIVVLIVAYFVMGAVAFSQVSRITPGPTPTPFSVNNVTVMADMFETMLVMSLVVMAIMLAVLFGLWRMATPEPGATHEQEGWSARRVIRVCVVGNAGFLVLSIAYSLATGGYSSNPFLAQPTNSGVTASIVVGIVMAIVGGLLGFVVFPLAIVRHLTSLMRRVPRPKLAAFGRVLFWGHAICAGILAFGYLAMLPVMFQGTAMAVSSAAATPPGANAAWIPGPGGTYTVRVSANQVWTAYPYNASAGPAGSAPPTLYAIGYLSAPPATTAATSSAPAFTPTWTTAPNGGPQYQAPGGTTYVAYPGPVIPSSGMIVGSCVGGLGGCADILFAIAGFIFVIMCASAIYHARRANPARQV